jgi:CDP-diacylglycerol---glycerol-3-phosphate 3-phosphatidyltransferase
MNVANALTVLRLALVPVCVTLLVSGGPGSRLAAFAAFAVASTTDLLDGELARRRNLITDFGKIADPIADKALTGSALVTLSALGELPWWVTVVILVRELAVTALRFWVIRQGVIAASRGGKIKTLLQVIAISLYILPGPIWLVRELFMGAAVVVTLATGIDYTIRAVRLHRAVPGPPAPAAAAAGPEPASPDSASPDSAGLDSAGLESAAPESAAPESAAPESGEPESGELGSAGSGVAGPGRPGAGSAANDSVTDDSAMGDSASGEPAASEAVVTGDAAVGPAGPAGPDTAGGQP